MPNQYWPITRKGYEEALAAWREGRTWRGRRIMNLTQFFDERGQFLEVEFYRGGVGRYQVEKEGSTDAS